MYIRIKYKYFVLYLITVIPIIVVDIVTYNELSKRLQENIINSHIEIVKQANNVLSLIKDSSINVNESQESKNVIIYSLVNSIMGNGSEVLITNQQHQVVYTTNNHLAKKNLHSQIYQSGKVEGFLEVRYLNVDRLMTYSYNPVTGLYLIILTPVDTALGKISYIESLMTILIVTSVILFIVLIFLISSRLTSPISSLSIKLEELERGNRKISDNKKVFIKDEMWQIGISFNKIVTQLEGHIKREYHYRMKANDARFLALQSQINPHFLHNTLETINSIAIIENVPLISELSRSLSKMFRYNTVNVNMFVSLKDEISHLENYLTVQMIRYDGVIQKKIDIDEEVYDCKITKFVLQPIVENCFIHGFQDLTSNGWIKITGHREREEVVIRVEDNGVGLNEDKLALINKELSAIDTSLDHEHILNRDRIGIFNVNNRIKLSFGSEFGIHLRNNEPSGLIVTVRLPYEKL